VTWLRRLLVLLLLAAAGCASSAPTAPPPRTPPPRARCLSNPNETDLRPLIFLFCVESP